MLEAIGLELTLLGSLIFKIILPNIGHLKFNIHINHKTIRFHPKPTTALRSMCLFLPECGDLGNETIPCRFLRI